MLPSLVPGQVIAELTSGEWQTQSRRRAFWRTCDKLEDDNHRRFAESVDGDARPMVPRHPREDETRWKARMWAASPSAYVRQIADHYLAHVTRTPPERATASGQAIPDACAAIVADADGYGTPLDRVLREVGRLAFVEGESYLLVDWTGTPGAASAADQAAARYVVRAIPADDVLVTEESVGGTVLAAIFRQVQADGSMALVRVDASEVQTCTLAPDGTATIGVPTSGAHTYGACPLIKVGPAPAVIPGVAERQRAICVLDSLIRYRQGEDTIPWIVVTGTANASSFVSELAKNPSFSAFEDPNAKATVIGAAVEVAASLRQALMEEEERLYKSAKVRPVQATGAPESGVAHAYRFVDADSELAELAAVLETAENAAWDRICAALGLSADPVRATWPDTFVPVDRGAELARLMLVAASTLPQPIKDREYLRAARTLYPGDKAIEEELRNTVDPGRPELPNRGT